MKKASNKKGDPDMLKEYDFSEGIRGKYAQRYAEGSNVVVLPPDLAEAFPSSEAVTNALCGLVSLARKTATSHREKGGKPNVMPLNRAALADQEGCNTGARLHFHPLDIKSCRANIANG